MSDQALILQRKVATEECGLAWEAKDLESRPNFPALIRAIGRVPSSMYLSLPFYKWLSRPALEAPASLPQDHIAGCPSACVARLLGRPGQSSKLSGLRPSLQGLTPGTQPLPTLTWAPSLPPPLRSYSLRTVKPFAAWPDPLWHLPHPLSFQAHRHFQS